MATCTDTEDALAVRRTHVQFDRNLVGLDRIVIRGALLSMVTFGVYRFWYMTELRRFFWSRTLIAGSPAQYTGRGRELFIGFLIATAVFLPIYLAIWIAALSFPEIADFSTLLLVVVLYPLVQYAKYRGRRYRTSRTSWRGIRLSQDGSARVYMSKAVGWTMLSLATFGLAYPFMRASLERYRIDHTLVGTSRMSSAMDGWVLVKPWLIFHLFSITPVIVAAIAFLIATDFTIPRDLFVPDLAGPPGKLTINEDYIETNVVFSAAILLVTVLICLLLAISLGPFYRAKELKAFLNAVRLGECRLESRLKARTIYAAYSWYALAFAGFVGLLLGITSVVRPALTQVGGYTPTQSITLALLVLAYLAGAFLLNLLYVRVIQVRLWRAVAETTAIENGDVLEGITASRHRVAGALDEGLSDAMGVGSALEAGL